MATATRLRCFASEDWWRFYQKVGGTRRTACHDCLPAYQAEMKACGMCEHPDVRFEEQDGGMVGVWPGWEREEEV